MGNGIGSHQSVKMLNDEWFTPPEIIKDLGPFNLDPCNSKGAPFRCADLTLTKESNLHVWNPDDFVWCNPPYGKYTSLWLNKMALHNNGIVLIFARTETKMFVDYVWNKATSLLFIYGRLHFYNKLGIRSKTNSGAPSVLIAYGKEADKRLQRSGIKGKYVKLF